MEAAKETPDAARAKWVTGRVAGLRHWADGLYTLLVDAPVEPFRAGQFARVALEVEGERIERPYSFVNAPGERPLEFYFIAVPGGPLTRRLVTLREGDAVWVSARPSGMMTLADLPGGEQLWLLSTGTGIGPFLSVLRTAEPWERFARVVLVHAVRTAAELSYRELVTALLQRHGERFGYVPFVSREESAFALRGRIPDAIRDGRLEAHAGLALAPPAARVMLCGNPDMVRDTLLALEARGLRRHKRKEPGQVLVETYW